MNTRVAVIGAGAWGTAVAKIVADKGHDVSIWSYEAETVEDINTNHRNERFLPGIALPANLSASANALSCVDGADFIILAAPSLFLARTVQGILESPVVKEGKAVIGIITKGFIPSPSGPRLIVETLEEVLPAHYKGALVYISGPSHAEEVATGKVTGLIAASENAKNSIRFRELLTSSRILVFSSLDVRGVQVCAATKNVVAVVFGMLDALKESGGMGDMFGDGTESLLLAAGLNEIQTLGHALGATHPETFSSIAGVGDLDVTCRSKFGRNRRFGQDIMRKNIIAPYTNLDDLIAHIGDIGYLPEGAVACKYAKELADRHNLKLTITNGLYRILNKEIKPLEFLNLLVKDLG